MAYKQIVSPSTCVSVPIIVGFLIASMLLIKEGTPYITPLSAKPTPKYSFLLTPEAILSMVKPLCRKE